MGHVRVLSPALCLLLYTIASPASGAGEYDGEWIGHVVAKDDSRRACGFEKSPFRMQVTGNRFTATSQDMTKAERKIDGEIAKEGRIKVWVEDWLAVPAVSPTAQPSASSGELNGSFARDTFRASFYLSARGKFAHSSLCEADIHLSRATATAAAPPVDPPKEAQLAAASVGPPYDGEWIGYIVAKNDSRRVCGFEKSPFRMQVTGTRFTATSQDMTKAERKIDGEISKEGQIKVWVEDWFAIPITSPSAQPTLSSGEIKGGFARDGFRAGFYLTSRESTLRAQASFCEADIHLSRVTATAAVAPVDPPKAAQAAAPTPVASPKAAQAATGASSPSVAAQLATLKQLHETGLIDATEFERRKTALLDTTFGAVASAPPAAAPTPPPAPPRPAVAADAGAWDAIKGSRNPADFEAFVAKHPASAMADAASAKAAEIKLAAAQAAEAAEWNRIKDDRSSAPFKSFLERYPSSSHAAAAAAKMQTLAAFEQIKGVNLGSFHALIVGNDNYKSLPKLKTAVNDARAIADLLTREYGFKVTTLLDATRSQLVDVLDDFREKLRENDNLLIYYAGHGWLDEDAQRGYWLPVDAHPSRRSNWLENTTITDTLKTLRAKHVMVVADSCYSGTLTRGAVVGIRSADYWERIAQKRARVVLTSGGKEPVADSAGGRHSPFARAFLDALRENTAVLDGTELFSQMRRPVMLAASQTPEFSDVRNAGHDGGDFLFVRKR